MPQQFTEKDFLDFAGGINQYDSDLLLADNESRDSRNVFSDGRALRKRRGFRQVCESDALYDIKSIHHYVNTQGASYLLKVHSDGSLYSMMAPPVGEMEAVQLATGSTAFELDWYYYFVRFIDVDGRISLPSKVLSVFVQSGTKSIKLTNIPVGPSNVVKKQIFRSIPSNSSFFSSNNILDNDAVVEITNETTEYTDTERNWNTLSAESILFSDILTSSNLHHKEKDYHGANVSIDVTNEINFVNHLDFAIICNGIDRIKWRAPMKRAQITANKQYVDTLSSILTQEVIEIEKDFYVHTNYGPGLHFRLYKTGSTTLIGMVQDVCEVGNYLSVIVNRGGTPYANDDLAGYTFYSTGCALPYGVPRPINSGDEISVFDTAAGGATKDGDTFQYRIANVNMNGSESATVLTPQIVVAQDRAVNVPLPPLDWTEITTGGTTTITAHPTVAGYYLISNASGFSEIFAANNNEEGEVLFIDSWVDPWNSALVRVISLEDLDTVDCTPTSTSFYVYNPGGYEWGAGRDTTKLKIYKINRATARKVYRTDESGAGEFYTLKSYTPDYSSLVSNGTLTIDKTTNSISYASGFTTSVIGGEILPGDSILTTGFTNASNNRDNLVLSHSGTVIKFNYKDEYVNETDTSSSISHTRYFDFMYNEVSGPVAGLPATFIYPSGLLLDYGWVRAEIRGVAPSDRRFNFGTTLTQNQPQDNDDPPRFKYATSAAGRIIAGNLNFGGLKTGQRDGSLDIGVFNYGEVEAMYFLNWTSLGAFNDTTEINGVMALTENVIVGTDQGIYSVENIDDVQNTAPSVQVLDNSGLIAHKTMQRITRPTGEQTVIYLGKDGLYEVWSNGIITPLGAQQRQDWRSNHPLKKLFNEALVYKPNKFQNDACSAIQITETRYLLNLRKDSSTQNDICIVYDFRDNAFWIFDGLNASSMVSFEGLLVHASGGSTYLEQNTNTLVDYMDNGKPVECWYETKFFPMEGMSFVKRWHELTIYPDDYSNYQSLHIGSKAEFENDSTAIGRTLGDAADGFTKRTFAPTELTVDVKEDFQVYLVFDVNPFALGVKVGDRIQISGVTGLSYENQGDFEITFVSTSFVGIVNPYGIDQLSSTPLSITDPSQIIIYYKNNTENDGLQYLYKNVILDEDRMPFRIKVAPSSARFMRFRFENVFSTQKLSLSGYTIRYGLGANKGIDR